MVGLGVLWGIAVGSSREKSGLVLEVAGPKVEVVRPSPGASFLVQAVRLAVAIGVALLVLAGSAWLLRIREFDQGVALVTRRLRRPAR